MSNWTTAFESRLVGGEKIIAVIEDLKIYFHFPSSLVGLESGDLNGALALTNRRLILGWKGGYGGWGWFHVHTVQGLVESHSQEWRNKVEIRYTLHVPGGIAVALWFQKAEASQSQRLASVVTEAFMSLRGAGDEYIAPPRD